MAVVSLLQSISMAEGILVGLTASFKDNPSGLGAINLGGEELNKARNLLIELATLYSKEKEEELIGKGITLGREDAKPQPYPTEFRPS